MRKKNRTKGLQNKPETVEQKMLSPYHLYHTVIDIPFMYIHNTHTYTQFITVLPVIVKIIS